MQTKLPKHWVVRSRSADDSSSGSDSESQPEKPVRNLQWTRVMTMEQMLASKVETFKIDVDV